MVKEVVRNMGLKKYEKQQLNQTKIRRRKGDNINLHSYLNAFPYLSTVGIHEPHVLQFKLFWSAVSGLHLCPECPHASHIPPEGIKGTMTLAVS